MMNSGKYPKMDDETVERILAKAFEANNIKPNQVPLEVLTSYSNYRQERFTFQKIILGIVLILFALLPFMFVRPEGTIYKGEDAGLGRPTYVLELKRRYMVSRVTAEIDGNLMPVYEVENGVFSIQPTLNGEMEVTVRLRNDQSCVMKQEVNLVDLLPPVLESDKVNNHRLEITVTDADSGVDFDACCVMTEDGRSIPPVAIDREQGIVYFDYPKENVNIVIPDMVGNILRVVIYINK